MLTPLEMYEQQLRRLNRYFAEGRDNDECAEGLRDQMDEVWSSFTSEEQDDARALSVRLEGEEGR